jgi:hypothetical protein
MVLSTCRVSAETQRRISVFPLFWLSGFAALQE